MLNVIPDGGEFVLQSQGFLNVPNGGFTGFGSSGSADGAGISGTSPIASGNPNATGGWQQLAADIIKAATQSFGYYMQGSPSVAVPPAQRPQTTIIQRPLATIGGTSITLGTVLIVVAVGGGIMFLLTR